MNVHLIGIGGTGMAALAGLLKEAGHEVRGSDGPIYPPMSTLLEKLKVPVFKGYGAENLDWHPDRVVVGNICRKDHPEARAARERGLELVSFPALLSELFLRDRHPIVIAGTHGKTTTASLMTHVLASASLNPGFLIGGIPKNKDKSYALGRPPYFVVEGDEYDCAYFDKRPKFVHYRPQTVILTSVEYDHADIYPTMADVEKAFRLLIQALPSDGRILVAADSAIALRLCQSAPCSVESYAVNGLAAAQWQAQVCSKEKGARLALAVSHQGEQRGTFDLPLTGNHNAANALAVIATCYTLGLKADAIAKGLATFGGVRRRQEVCGVAREVTVIDDFAHHPTAIRETLRGLRGVYGSGKLVAVFEPRSATCRRRVFQQELVQALSLADHVVMAGLHEPENIPLADRLAPETVAADLSQAGITAVFIEDIDAIADHLAAICRPSDTVVVMSSGAFGGLHHKLLAKLI